MSKKLVGIVIIALILLCVLGLTGCKKYSENLHLLGENFERENMFLNDVFLNVGETTEVDFSKLFNDRASSFSKIELKSSDKGIFTVSGNKIKAVGMGCAYAEATVYGKDGLTKQTVKVAFNVYVVNPKKMKEVKTAQDLANMGNDPKGKYILKSDIDLKDYEDWRPIAQYSSTGDIEGWFSGMFINPDGYKIKNLTIRSVSNILKDKDNYVGVGLFHTIMNAYLDGVILENVSIDTTTNSEELYQSLEAGGICSYSIKSVIKNCRVDGLVASQKTAGGITANLIEGSIICSSFKGMIKNTSSNEFGGSGGIAGRGNSSVRIINCVAEAEIDGALYAGGIIGLGDSYYSLIEDFIKYCVKNCSFRGKLNAPHIGDMCGFNG